MSRRIIRRTVPLLVGALSALAVFSTAAFASGSPIINANTPSQNSLNTAVIGGTLDPNGASTTYKVEYGRTKLYGQTTQSFTAAAGEIAALNIELFGLQQMSTYHYRISATNIFGTTTTPDALFETLLSWKVAGTRVESLSEPATYEDKYKGGAGEGGKVEFLGISLGHSVRIYCRQSAASNGALGVEYAHLEFNKGCFTQVDGVISEVCKPSGVTLHLNGSLGQSSATSVKTGEACLVGEAFSFSLGGFALGSTPEAAEQPLELYGMTYFASKSWNMIFTVNTMTTTGAWKLSGANAGKVFGIS